MRYHSMDGDEKDCKIKWTCQPLSTRTHSPHSTKIFFADASLSSSSTMQVPIILALEDDVRRIIEDDGCLE